MSSSTYSAELKPDTKLRVLVLSSGICLGLIGLLLIMALPLQPAASTAAAAAWLLISARELRGLIRGFRACRGIRIAADGSLMRLDQVGGWREARLLPGSIVLPGLAWIRLETVRGVPSAELLRGSSLDSYDWRRLQVIWRHIGAAG